MPWRRLQRALDRLFGRGVSSKADAPASSPDHEYQEPVREQVVGQTLVGIAHSPYSAPEFIIEGIGPARFRTHYLTLSNGLVLDLFVAEVLTTSLPRKLMKGETSGLPPRELIGRCIIAVDRDHESSPLVILEGWLFLKDGHDGCYGNPLLAGRLEECYTVDQLSKFVDYWDEKPASPERGNDPKGQG